jgi:hypothetical protein
MPVVACHRSLKLSEFGSQFLWLMIICRNRTKARTTKTLIWTACGLFSTLAAMIAPCSVKAYGRYLMFCPRFNITDCDLERDSASGACSNMKSSRDMAHSRCIS